MATASSPRAERLRDAEDIGEVVRAGAQRAGRLLVVYALGRHDDRPARVATVASRKVGGAVARNRTKRLLREATRHLEWRNGVDVVLVARAACAGSNLHDVRLELAGLASQLGLCGG